MNFASVMLSWTCVNKQCTVENSEFNVPLQYWNESSEKLKLKVVRSINENSKMPIFIVGPGIGRSNIVKDFDNLLKNYPNTSFYMVGYRGIDSEPKIEDGDVKSLTTLAEEKITDKILDRIQTKTLSKYNLSDYWIPQRAQDLILFMKIENIKKAHLFSIGETGSLITHQLLSDYPEYFDRIVIVSSSVPSPVHNETTPRLLGTYRRLCREDPANCPYHNIRWLPPQIPSSVMYAFKVSRERVIFATEHQLRNPSTAPMAFDVLQALTDNSKMGYLTFNTMPGAEMMNYKWIDVAMHICAKPADNSFYAPVQLRHICKFIPDLSTEFKNQFTNPILLIIGELDLPRQPYVLGFYKNNSLNPNDVDYIFLNKSNSKYEFGRPDVTAEVISYLNTGKFNVENINQTQKIIWKNSFSATSMMKWIFGASILSTVLISVWMLRKENNESRRDRIRAEWAKKQQNRVPESTTPPKKQEKQRKDKRD